MKDANDKQTLDLLTGKRGRGRPRKEGALTGAQRQAAYRRNIVTVTLSWDQAAKLRVVALEAGEDGLAARLYDALDKHINRNSNGKKTTAKKSKKSVTVTENLPLATPAVYQPAPPVTVTKNDRPAVRYVNPENPDMGWTGRGRKPLWVQELLDRGLTLEQLEVK